jgi:CMP-N-acetylneuraminic acid synthetase
LASDEARGDDFAADFMENVKCNTLVMISPVCPLITPEDVSLAMKAYEDSNCDTLITCEETQMQVFCKGRGVNINELASLAPSQDNPQVQILNWAVTIWDVSTYLQTYRTERKGYLGTNRLLFPIDPLHAVKVSNEKDFYTAERIMRSFKYHPEESIPQYWTPK